MHSLDEQHAEVAMHVAPHAFQPLSQASAQALAPHTPCWWFVALLGQSPSVQQAACAMHTEPQAL